MLIRSLALALVVCLAIAAQDWQTAAGGRMRFDVAGIKPSTAFKPPNFPLDPGDAKTAGGRMSVVFPLITYVAFAYKLMPDEISKPLPKSFPTNASFEIEARAPGNPTKDQMRLMMQSLLAERFKLKVHFETQQGSVLALTLVRPGHTGSKLHPHAEGPQCPEAFEMAPPGSFPNPKDVFPPVCGTTPMWGTKDRTLIGGRDVTMEVIAGAIHNYGSLATEIDRSVVDQTGLKGRYDFTLELPPGAIHLVTVVASISNGALPDVPETPFTNALRDQLGLKLVSTKGPIRKLVIDHVEPLSGN
ncbi:MAG TPA: TIGR03435 family protein [Bryobacteraceae bacterium]|jgi:uncharacterized protein (TIGR03435 family)